MTWSHLDGSGHIKMVDISDKSLTDRTATAEANVILQSDTIERIFMEQITKGNVITTAKIAGIQAAKDVAKLIPLCHSIPLSWIDITINRQRTGLHILATVKSKYSTGVEMEALTAVSIAALTVYDMCKSIDNGIKISGVCLLEKKGGKSST